MSRIRLFLDSSALVSGIISPNGAARVLLLLGEARRIELLITEQVIAETERALARKVPAALPIARQMILHSQAGVLQDPPAEEVRAHLYWMTDPADVPILLAAMNARVDFLVTLNRRHFLEDAQVAQRSGLLIGTPGDALAWVRQQFGKINSQGLR